MKDLPRGIGVVATLIKPVEYDAVDDRPIDVIVALLFSGEAGPDANAALACVTRRLRSPAAAEAIRSARDEKALFNAVVG